MTRRVVGMGMGRAFWRGLRGRVEEIELTLALIGGQEVVGSRKSACMGGTRAGARTNMNGHERSHELSNGGTQI